jgi:hypothetical protein
MTDRKYDIDFASKIENGKLITSQSQDCEPVVRSVQALKHADGGKKQFGYHAARIPQLLLMKWALEDAGDQLAYMQGRQNREPELAKKLAVRLNSNEFHAFRIWEGEVAASDMLKEGNKL